MLSRIFSGIEEDYLHQNTSPEKLHKNHSVANILVRGDVTAKLDSFYKNGGKRMETELNPIAEWWYDEENDCTEISLESSSSLYTSIAVSILRKLGIQDFQVQSTSTAADKPREKPESQYVVPVKEEFRDRVTTSPYLTTNQNIRKYNYYY